MCGNHILPRSFDGRRAYYSLSKYAGSNVVPDVVSRTPFIVERYWLDQAMYSLAKTFTNGTLPPSNTEFYKYPADIVVPDLTFFINIDSDGNSRSSASLFNQR
uniref:Uncharacterized protein n=4 Tax=Clastoptera arizonana TaxID=38151 RepID=A0A1B6CR25_9HEMI